MSRFSSRLRSGRALPLAAALAASGSGLAYYTLSPNRVAHADGAPKIDLGLRATPTSDLVRSWVVYKIWYVLAVPSSFVCGVPLGGFMPQVG